MKAHTQTFKDNLIKLGKEIDVKITYTIDSVETELDGDTISSVSPHYEGNILKSVMKQVDIKSTVDIPIGTLINVQFGMKFDTEPYEYINYGNYIVNKSDFQEDTKLYLLTCYDKMLYSMKDYEELEITYPITIRDYISAICTKIGLEFANANDMFANYDKEIKQDLYANLGYTFRDVLDEIAQVTASTICINQDDKLEVRYLNESVNESQEVEGTNLTLSNSESAKISGVEIDGEITQETTTGKNLLGSTLEQMKGWNTSGTWSGNKFTRSGVDITPIFVNGLLDSIELKGTCTGNFTFVVARYTRSEFLSKITVGSSYTLSGCPSGGTNTTYYLRLHELPWKILMTDIGNSFTITMPSISEDAQTISMVIGMDSGTNVNGKVFKPMLRLSNTSSAYEPYTNGASPNSEYPQNVEITTGRQEVDIIGKNLLDLRNGIATGSNSGITATKQSDYTYTFVGTATSNTPNIWLLGSYATYYNYTNYASFDKTKILFSLQPGTYIIKDVGIFYIHEDNTRGSAVPTIGNKSTFTLTKTAHIVAVRTPIMVNGTTYDTIIYPQIESGSNSTDYEPYKIKEHEINLGKNLFDYTTTAFAIPDRVRIETYDNTIKITTLTETTSQDLFLRTKIPDELLTNGETYTISSVNVSGVYKDLRLQLRNKNGSSVSGKNQAVSLTYDNAYSLYIVQNPFATSNSTVIPAGTVCIIKNVQVEKGNVATSYSPYFEPIFLGKINTYKDFIRRGTGKNLFDKDNLTRINGTINVGTNSYFRGGGANYAVVIPCEPNTTYTVQKRNDGDTNRFAVASSETIPSGSADVDTTLPNAIRNDNASSITITTSSNAKYLVVNYYRNVETLITDQQLRDSIQIELGTQATEYEPYGFKDKWYLYKTIGKVVLNGSENWQNAGTNPQKWSLSMSGYKYIDENICISDYFKSVENGPVGIMTDNQIKFRYHTDKAKWLYICDNRLSAVANFKTWLGTHNVTLYYVLAIPITIEITNNNYPELLSQLKALDNAKTYEGVTNILSTFPIKFSYATEYETIDEDYIKNTRADFGEKYGPINSIVLSRSADSDNIYIKDQDSIDENGLCEVKIKDNQIMNDNDRSDFLPDLLEYLKYIEYYINDFESIGITYLDLCDKYKVKIDDKKYDCVMFNDEVGIHDGLNEIIYTNKPKQNVTDYKKASTTDKQERQTYLMVDKQAQRIDALISDEEENFSRIQVEIDNISSQVQSTNVELDELGNEIEVVRSSITEQTSTAITDWFDSNLKSQLEDLQNTTESNSESLNNIKSYVRRGIITDPQSPYYNQAYVEIGDDTNQTTLRILPNRIQFLTNGQETAFISNNQLYINESTILTKEKVGHWVTTEDENGLLNTYWED